MKYVRADLKLVIAGPVENARYERELRQLIANEKLQDRVELRIGFLPREEIVALVNNALACAAAPVDEDSISYVAMEAFAAAKSVVTVADAGGLLEIVRDRDTGDVVDPIPELIGAAFERIASNPAEAERTGRRARALWDSLDITWQTRIDRLLS
jgi:glycosyltransferase involved in cell wall biosynthesis